MAKQLTIKQISELSGVSAGTVDRILHNRGRVSDEARTKVEAVLNREGYKYNIHTSAVSLKRGYTIGVVCPQAIPGGFWQMVRDGIAKACEEYSDIDIRVLDFAYNQYDINSCREVYSNVLNVEMDAVIIGGTFAELTHGLCKGLDKKEIPYVFVDTEFESCSPVGSYTPDQFICGRVMARMADSIIAPGKQIAVLRISRTGDIHSYNTDRRMEGMMDYLKGRERDVRQFFFTVSSWRSELHAFLRDLKDNREIEALTIMNSWAFHVSDMLKENEIEGLKVCGFDATKENLRCLKDGSLTLLLDQHPQQQGFQSLERLIEYLIYRTPPGEGDFTTIPVNIIIKEML